MNEMKQHAIFSIRSARPKLFLSPSTSLTSDHPQVLSDQTKRLLRHRCWLVESEADILSVKLMSTQRVGSRRKMSHKVNRGPVNGDTLAVYSCPYESSQKLLPWWWRECVCVWQRKSNGEHMAILRQMWQAELFTQSCSVSVFAWFVWTVQTTFPIFIASLLQNWV